LRNQCILRSLGTISANNIFFSVFHILSFWTGISFTGIIGVPSTIAPSLRIAAPAGNQGHQGQIGAFTP
jgi:hypothetical protein